MVVVLLVVVEEPPVNLTVDAGPRRFWCTTSWALRVPLAPGVNRTVIVHDSPGSRARPSQPFSFSANSFALVPLNSKLVTFNGALPTLRTTIGEHSRVTPTLTKLHVMAVEIWIFTGSGWGGGSAAF
ncbi:MAG TPA: hypothetical protein VGR06_03275, partial [Actinophytocola sp.]|nr:hypothetical protein [Actinophytocola sp.]